MAYSILGTPKPAFFDSSGSPLVSGTITTQDASTDAVKASYPTSADADASTNGTSGDITLDARGETPNEYWGRDGEDYKVTLKDSDAAQVWSVPKIVLAGSSRRPTVTFTSGDATPTIVEGDNFITAGTTQITDFDDGVVGDTIHIQAATTISIAHSAAVLLAEANAYYMEAGDTLTLTMFVDQVWQETGRGKQTGGYGTGESVITTNTITLAENGKTFFLNSTTGFVSTLPPAANGARFTFIIKTIPTSGNNTIVTDSSDNIMSGFVLDVVGELVYATARDVITFVQDGAIGDRVDLVSDGTLWYYKGFCGVDGKLTTGQT